MGGTMGWGAMEHGEVMGWGGNVGFWDGGDGVRG